MIIILLLKAIPIAIGRNLAYYPDVGRFGVARFHDLLILSFLNTSLFEKEMLD